MSGPPRGDLPLHDLFAEFTAGLKLALALSVSNAVQDRPESTRVHLSGSRHTQRGVTRLELLLFGAVAAIGLIGFTGWKWYAAQSGVVELARERGHVVLTAASDWKRDHLERGCPSITQLQRASLLESTARAEDPWGQRFQIRCLEGQVRVLSAGKDGRFETSDDIALAAEPNT